jgi:uncharacterized membrane protein
MPAPPRLLALACHVTLMALLAAAILGPAVTVGRWLATAAVVLPLALTLRGLATGQARTQRWLAVLLVPYAGGFSVEVVARAGAAPLLGVGLMVAVLELGLTLALIRRPPPTARE